MRINKEKLTQIILEETKKVLEEQNIGAELDSIIKQLSALKGKAGGAPVAAGGEAVPGGGGEPAEEARIDAAYEKAAALFKDEKYKEAAKAYGDLNRSMKVKRPATTYNAARSYEMAGQRDLALMVYKQFLTLKDAPEEYKQRVQKKIAALSADEPVD